MTQAEAADALSLLMKEIEAILDILDRLELRLAGMSGTIDAIRARR